MLPLSIVIFAIFVIVAIKFGVPWIVREWNKSEVEEKKNAIRAEKEMADSVSKINRKEVQNNRSKVKQFVNEN